MTTRADNEQLLNEIIAAFGGELSYPYVRGAVVAGQKCDPYLGMDGSIVVSTEKGLEYTWTDLARYIRMTLGVPARPIADNDNHPVDLWAEREKPSLPEGILPPVIEEFARTRADQMGVDPGGLALSALAVCSAAIPDKIKLQVKRHDPDWLESARLWVALIGNPSTRKTPIISTAVRPLRTIDGDMIRVYLEATAAYSAMDKDTRATAEKPKQTRALVEDTTVESAQEVLRDNSNGVLLLRDELAGWFGSMERYGGTKGAAADRSFWLEAFNGGAHTANRIGRGLVHVPNLSVCLLGGIQPEPIRAIANDMHDDGLLQRILPVVLGSAGIGKDEPQSASTNMYGALVQRLHHLEKPRGNLMEIPLRFDDGAQAIRAEMEVKHNGMVQTWEAINKKLAAHIGKYDSFFARLCVVFHCIESTGTQPASVITEDTARRVAEFLHRYLFRHALAFYGNVVGLSDRHDKVLATAGYILAHKMQTVSVRDIRRGDRTMRKMDEREAAEVLSQLDAFGWLDPVPLLKNETSPKYQVRSFVHRLFEDRAEQETLRRASVREAILEATTGV